MAINRLAINLSGALVAAIIAAAIYGQQAEESLFPVMRNLTVSDVRVEGRRVSWTLGMCKVRDLHLDTTSFTFNYDKGTGPGVQVQITNEITNAPAGKSPLRQGCFSLRYSAIVPMDASKGDSISGIGRHDSSHPFWMVKQSFGTIVLPAAAVASPQ